MDEKNNPAEKKMEEKKIEEGTANSENESTQEERQTITQYRAQVNKMSDSELENLFAKAKDAALYIDALQKTQADFENYRKRVEREKIIYMRYANQDLLKNLVNIADLFDKALTSGDSGQNLYEGISILYKEFLKILADFGVKQVEALEKPFNPNFHEAVMQQESDKYPEMTIVQEFSKGYLYHDRLLRASKVAISKLPQKKES